MNTPFIWGENDCALFACDCAREIIGVDLAYHFRGKYTSEYEAYELLYGFAGGGILETAHKIANEFDIKTITTGFAVRGDIGFIAKEETGLSDCLAVCAGVSWFTPGDKGLVSFNKKSVTTSWRIG